MYCKYTDMQTCMFACMQTHNHSNTKVGAHKVTRMYRDSVCIGVHSKMVRSDLTL